MVWGWTKKESAEQSQSPESDDQIHKDVLLAGRDACYKARDMFYACVEKNVKSKPTEIASVGLLYPAECKRARIEFEKQCRPTWAYLNCSVSLGLSPIQSAQRAEEFTVLWENAETLG